MIWRVYYKNHLILL